MWKKPFIYKFFFKLLVYIFVDLITYIAYKIWQKKYLFNFVQVFWKTFIKKVNQCNRHLKSSQLSSYTELKPVFNINQFIFAKNLLLTKTIKYGHAKILLKTSRLSLNLPKIAFKNFLNGHSYFSNNGHVSFKK